MNVVLVAGLFLQESALGQLHRAAQATQKQISYHFSFNPGGQKGRGVTGVHVPGAVYLKSGLLEVVRSTEMTLVRREGGEWKTYVEATTDPKVRALVDDLLRTPAPHQLVSAVLEHLRKPVEDGSIYKGELSEAYARQLPRVKWFARTDGARWAETKGSLAVRVGEGGLISSLQFDLQGKLLPADGRGIPKKPPKKPDPRSAKKYKLPDIGATLNIRLSQFGQAKLPVSAEIANRLGLTQSTR